MLERTVSLPPYSSTACTANRSRSPYIRESRTREPRVIAVVADRHVDQCAEGGLAGPGRLNHDRLQQFDEVTRGRFAAPLAAADRLLARAAGAVERRAMLETCG
jgi:hypothetical protein